MNHKKEKPNASTANVIQAQSSIRVLIAFATRATRANLARLSCADHTTSATMAAHARQAHRKPSAYVVMVTRATTVSWKCARRTNAKTMASA